MGVEAIGYGMSLAPDAGYGHKRQGLEQAVELTAASIKTTYAEVGAFILPHIRTVQELGGLVEFDILNRFALTEVVPKVMDLLPQSTADRISQMITNRISADSIPATWHAEQAIAPAVARAVGNATLLVSPFQGLTRALLFAQDAGYLSKKAKIAALVCDFPGESKEGLWVYNLAFIKDMIGTNLRVIVRDKRTQQAFVDQGQPEEIFRIDDAAYEPTLTESLVMAQKQREFEGILEHGVSDARPLKVACITDNFEWPAENKAIEDFVMRQVDAIARGEVMLLVHLSREVSYRLGMKLLRHGVPKERLLSILTAEDLDTFLKQPVVAPHPGIIFIDKYAHAPHTHKDEDFYEKLRLMGLYAHLAVSRASEQVRHAWRYKTPTALIGSFLQVEADMLKRYVDAGIAFLLQQLNTGSGALGELQFDLTKFPFLEYLYSIMCAPDKEFFAEPLKSVTKKIAAFYAE